MMDSQTMLYMGVTLFLALIPIFTLGAYGPLAFVAAAFSILAIILILVINYMDYFAFPALTYILNLKIAPAKGYTIPKTQDYVLKSVGGLYYATGYLTANLYSFVFEQESQDYSLDEKLIEAPGKWERILMSIKFPFRFHMLSHANDIQKYRDDLDSRRGYLAFQLSRESSSSNPSQMSMDELQKKINALQTRIERLSQDEKPLSSIMYLETIGVGVSEKAAKDTLDNQLNKLSTVFNAFDVGIRRVTGRELYQLFEFNYVVPSEANEFPKLFNEDK